MYRKESEGWFKHTDFILIDMICLQIAFYLAYLIKGLGINPYNDLVYRNMAIVLELADLVTMFMLDMLSCNSERSLQGADCNSWKCGCGWSFGKCLPVCHAGRRSLLKNDIWHYSCIIFYIILHYKISLETLISKRQVG